MTQTTQTVHSSQPGEMTQDKTDMIAGLKSLYMQDLRELYNAENQIVQALPVMAASATNSKLQKGFKAHQQQSETHAQRLEQIFKSLGENPNGMISKGMNALIAEGQILIKQKAPGALLDAGLISAAQHVEHYEIASYGTVSTWAKLLGREDDAKLLEQTLEEEKETDQMLTQLAENIINSQADDS